MTAYDHSFHHLLTPQLMTAYDRLLPLFPSAINPTAHDRS